jgi:hypothetical protein
MAPTWNDVADELTTLLALLRDGDALALEVGPYFIQFKRFGPVISVIASGTGPGVEEDSRLSADQARQMAALGWQPPDEEVTHSLPDVARPLSAADARRVADLLLATVRDVYGAATPAAATFSSHNDGGQRAPTLATVPMNPAQAPETPVVAAALLPPPEPTWQRTLEAVRAGVGGWSNAEVEAVFAGRGWDFTDRDRYGTVKAVSGAVRVTAYGGRKGDTDFTRIDVDESVPLAESGSRFRAALAAAVAVLGDPPLVGGPGAFARWRGKPLTVIVSHRALRTTARVRLTVTPTDAIEREEYSHSNYTPGWTPDYRWTTMPDTDAPANAALGGMMTYPYPPAETLDQLGSDLRELFASFAADLPLLHPYASDASFRIFGAHGAWLADGVFTHERASVAVGSANAPRETFALDGPATGATIATRVMDALRAAGITSPDQLSGSVWSATPAERLDADGFTIRRR